MNKQTKMNSSQLIESIERDPSSTFWLLDQVRLMDRRDLYDLMQDVDLLKQVLDLKWDETTRELRAEQDLARLRNSPQAKMVKSPSLDFLQSSSSMRLDRRQEKMVNDFLAGKGEHQSES